MKNVKALTVRFNLDKQRDLNVWKHLHHEGTEKYHTCSNAVIEELNDYIQSVKSDEHQGIVISNSVKTAIRQEFARILALDRVPDNDPAEYPEPKPEVEPIPDDVDYFVFNNELFDG